MKIVNLTPGTGNFHCGSCLRDVALARALRELGHDVTIVPLYLPFVLDGKADEETGPLFLGGINMYLQQKSRLFRHTPQWIDRLFDRENLLRRAADRAGMTSARDLGEMTVSSLQGADGRQKKELGKLVTWLEKGGTPDLVVFSNGLLSGVAGHVREELGVPVVVTLQGEDAFLDTLPEPWRTQAWDLFASHSGHVSAYLPVSHYYGGVMQERLGIDPDKIRTVPNGIDCSPFFPGDKMDPPTIGYLARLCHGKGLGAFVDAFIHLRSGVGDVHAHIAGTMTGEDEEFLGMQTRKLEDAGVMGDVTVSPNLDQGAKAAFLRGLTLFSVPATYGESFGLYVIEALASGVPVVQPNHAAFPEIIAATGGGVLCEPDDPVSLAYHWARLLADETKREQLATTGRAKALEHYSIERMAREVADVYSQLSSMGKGC